MLTEAVLDGSQAMRDPVGGSVEFHFVPILKLISTILIMGIFNDEDTKHILKMIDPNVFSGKEDEEEEGEKAEEGGPGEGESEEAKEDEAELEDEGVGDEEEEGLQDVEKGEHAEEEAEPKEPGEEGEKEADDPKGGKVDGEKAEEEKEAEAEAKEEEEGLEEGLLQMKLPESVKLQVSLILNTVNTYVFTTEIYLTCCSCCFPLSDVHAAAVLLRLRAATQSGRHCGLFRPVCGEYTKKPAGSLQPVNESLHHVSS